VGIEIRVPKIADASNLSVGRWFKRVGDPVSIGEPVVEIDTYNLTHEKPRKASVGQKEMLLPIEGKRGAEKKKAAKPERSTKRKAG
jgi:hypothetical protein